MSSFRCPNCGFLNFAGAESCKRCKTELSQVVADLAASPVSVNSLSDSLVNPTSNKLTIDNVAVAVGTGQNVDSLASVEGNPNQRRWKQNQDVLPSHHQDFKPSSQPYPASSLNSPHSPQPKPDSDEGKKTGMATASLVLGIIGFFTAGLLGIGAIIGVILGGIALQRASKNPGEYGGKGLSIAGIALNSLSVVSIFFIGIIAAIAIPNLLAARSAANEGAAIGSMRTLLQAEAEFMKSSTVNRCGDLNDLLGAQLIDRRLANGEKSGYKYTISKNANGSCELFASPLVSSGVGKTGTRSFYASTIEWEIRVGDKNGPLLRMIDNSTGTRSSRSDERAF